ncbi:MAG: cell division protein SepF [Eubacterium sp.]|jgi:Uncharacterized protein conserved in bacteria|nr:cell division protein SepF [Eubacterium sp.]
MGVLDKFLDMMKLNAEDDEDDFYDEFDDDEYEEEMPKKRSFRRSQEEKEEAVSYTVVDNKSREKTTKQSQKVTPMRTSRRVSGNMEVCIIKPISFNDSKEITETLLSNRTVILNLEGLNLDVAQRIIDFACGSSFAINGNLQKISDYIFIITPAQVDISGDFSEIADAFDMPAMQSMF